MCFEKATRHIFCLYCEDTPKIDATSKMDNTTPGHRRETYHSSKWHWCGLYIVSCTVLWAWETFAPQGTVVWVFFSMLGCVMNLFPLINKMPWAHTVSYNTCYKNMFASILISWIPCVLQLFCQTMVENSRSVSSLFFFFFWERLLISCAQSHRQSNSFAVAEVQRPATQNSGQQSLSSSRSNVNVVFKEMTL